jgi:hypothetical protein
MQSTISQILYPNRQAFFEKLALSLPSQPAIRIGPAPLPSGIRSGRIAKYAKGRTDTDIVLGATKYAGKTESCDNAPTGAVLEQ